MTRKFAPDEPDTATPRSRRFIRYTIAFVILLGLLLGGVGLHAMVANRRLQEAFVEADRLDPGWRYEELDAKRESIPDAENAALVVIAVEAKLPPNWPEWGRPVERELLPGPDEESLPPPEPLPPPAAHDLPPELLLEADEPGPRWARKLMGTTTDPPDENDAFQEGLLNLPPPVRLTPEQAKRIRAEVRRAAEAVALARRLADMPRGRHPVGVAAVAPTIPMPPSPASARLAAFLLSNDAQLRADDGDLEGALVSCRAILNAAASLGDEPCHLCMLARTAIRRVGLTSIEHVLAQGELSIDTLEAVQARLETEAELPLLLISVRGERALADKFFEAVQRGDLKISQLRNPHLLDDEKFFQEYTLLHLPGTVATMRAAMLRRMTEAVEIAKLPSHEQYEPFQHWQAAIESEPPLVRNLLKHWFGPAATMVAHSDPPATAYRRSQAEFRCAAAALAVERFRRKEGRWPTDLAELVPAYLKAVPLDPFDGKPLRYRFDAEGVVIYSTGPDRKDDGGSFDTLNTREGPDLGFRLYEPGQRGRPQP